MIELFMVIIPYNPDPNPNFLGIFSEIYAMWK